MSNTLSDLEQKLAQWELVKLLGGPYDKLGAYLTIQAGAGGTDAQDWAEMLERMYIRWTKVFRFLSNYLSCSFFRFKVILALFKTDCKEKKLESSPLLLRSKEGMFMVTCQGRKALID